jgi:carbon monoxide dehydrogenase subunit G
MSATIIKSDTVEINASTENAFNFLSDFNNFEKLMPPQVTDWKSTSNECSFVINGMASIGMRIEKKDPPTSIHIVSQGGKLPFPFTLKVNLERVDEINCKGHLLFEAEMNPMIKMMAEKPLTNFFNLLAQRMKDIR